LESLFDDGDEKVDRHGDPNLSFDGILGGSKGAFDAQMLFDPFKEQLHLPAGFVELGDSQCWQGEVIGEEDESLPSFGIAVCDAPEFIGVIGGGIAPGGANGLIAFEPGVLINAAGIEPAEAEIGATAHHEDGGPVVEAMEAGEVNVSAIHDIERAGLGNQLVEHPGVMPPDPCNMDERRNVAAQAEQCVKFDGGLGALIGRPGE